jgi:hypothetical protein
VADDGSEVFTIDLRRLTFASPLDLAGVAALAEHHAVSGSVRLQLPTDEAVTSYLGRMNLLDNLPGQVSLEGPVPGGDRRALDKILVEVSRVTSAEDAEGMWARFGDIALTHFGESAKLVFKATGELLGNAVTHGSQPGAVITAAQYYSGKTSGRGGLEVAICDTGVGVLRHLRRNPRFARITTSTAALRVAFQAGASGVAEDKDRGFGLADVLQLVGRLDLASLILASGDCALFKRWNGRLLLTQETRLITPIEGTWAWLRVRLPRGEE